MAGDHDDAAELVAMARRRGMSPDQMADNILDPVTKEMLRILPAEAVARAFEKAAGTARAKAKSQN